jgi:tetratricopeptide (TPR) repeat protein
VPFIGDVAVDVVTAHINAEVPPLPSTHAYPIGLREVIDKSLAKKPAHRFQSAQEFLEAMEELDDARMEMGGMPQERGAEGKRSNFGVVLVLTILLASVATAIGAKYYLARENKGAQEEADQVMETRIEQAVEFYPGVSEKKVAQLLNNAEEQIKNSLYGEAIATVKKALIIDPEQPVARRLLGHALFVSNDRKEAMDAYEETLKADGTLAEDERLMAYLTTGLEYDESREKAAAILAQFGGEKGIEILTARANSKLFSHRKERGVARKALIAVKREDTIDWVATLSADFENYRYCKKRKEIIAQMVALEDPRFLPFLEAQQPANGRWNKAIKCYKEDVEQAISALKEIEKAKAESRDVESDGAESGGETK